jgi:hypothetical protein
MGFVRNIVRIAVAVAFAAFVYSEWGLLAVGLACVALQGVYMVVRHRRTRAQ